MPRILAAFNAFKGGLSSAQANEAALQGVRQALPDAEIDACVVADGGDGTLEALVEGLGGFSTRVRCSDPLGRPIRAPIGFVDAGSTAVVEMARASGLALLKDSERNPLRTGSRGTGLLLRYAVRSGAKQVILGLGGSATNDAGIGLASVFGWKFLDRSDQPVSENGEGLLNLHRIVRPSQKLPPVRMMVACDVRNPLYGPQGAAHVYGPQKGATPTMVDALDQGLRRFARIVKRDLGMSIDRIPGGGAAGGLGVCLAALFEAPLKPGVDLIFEITGMDAKVRTSDLVLTGEGAFDTQSLQGKAPIGVSRLALRHGVPCFLFAGHLQEGNRQPDDSGVTATFPLSRRPATQEESLLHAKAWLRDSVREAVRAWDAGRRHQK